MSAVSFPLVFAALVWLRLKAHSGRQWRRCVLEAALLLGVGTIVATELLGLSHSLRPLWILLAWALAGGGSALYLWRELRQASPVRDRVAARCKGMSWRRLSTAWSRLELIGFALVLGTAGVIAWASPPTNFDSMTYQMPRVMHWLQQGTLHHYPASNIRQLAYGPGAAYWQVQLWSVFDGDIAANLPQWCALVGSALALTLCLERLVDRRAIGFAVMVGVTLPMGLLQACSTQTDLQVGCWVIAGLALLHNRPEPLGTSRALFGGLAMGLALLTKPSAALCIAPLVVAALWPSFRIEGARTVVARGLTLAAVALAINLPHFARNYSWFGSPLGDSYGTIVDSISPRLALANAVRWLVLNVPSVNAWQVAADMSQWLGVDPNHPAITFSYCRFVPASPYVIYRLFLPDEDFAAYVGTLLVIAILALLAVLSLRSSSEGNSEPRKSGVGLWLTALVVALALHFLLLKWQWWGNRLLLPLALLGLPFLAALTGAWRRGWLRNLTVTCLLVQAAFVLTFSLNRPLVPLPKTWNFVGALPLFGSSRTERFYAGYNAEAVPVCQQLVAAVKQTGVRRIGLMADENYPEYVLWRALHDAGLRNREIHDVSASPSSRHPEIAWPPAVDISIKIEPSTLGESWMRRGK